MNIHNYILANLIMVNGGLGSYSVWPWWLGQMVCYQSLIMLISSDWTSLFQVDVVSLADRGINIYSPTDHGGEQWEMAMANLLT